MIDKFHYKFSNRLSRKRKLSDLELLISPKKFIESNFYKNCSIMMYR